MIVFSGASSHGALVVGTIHHVTSHFKGSLLENKVNLLQCMCSEYVNLSHSGIKPFLLLLAFK